MAEIQNKKLGIIKGKTKQKQAMTICFVYTKSG